MRGLVLFALLLLGGCGCDKRPDTATPEERVETTTTMPESNTASYERALEHVRSSYLAEGWTLHSEQRVTILAKGLGTQTFELQVAEGGGFEIVVVTDTATAVGCLLEVGGDAVDVYLGQIPFEDQDVAILGTGNPVAAAATTVKFSLHAYEDQEQADGRLFIFTR